MEAKPGQILISPRVLTKVEHAVKVEPVGEFELKGIGVPWRRTTCSPETLAAKGPKSRIVFLRRAYETAPN